MAACASVAARGARAQKNSPSRASVCPSANRPRASSNCGTGVSSSSTVDGRVPPEVRTPERPLRRTSSVCDSPGLVSHPTNATKASAGSSASRAPCNSVGQRTPQRTPSSIIANNARSPSGPRVSSLSPAPRRVPTAPRARTAESGAAKESAVDSAPLGLATGVLAGALQSRRPRGGWTQFALILQPLLGVPRLSISQWQLRIRFCNDDLKEAYLSAGLLQLVETFPDVFLLQTRDAAEAGGHVEADVSLRCPPTGADHSPLCPQHTGAAAAACCHGTCTSCYCAYLACNALLEEDARAGGS